MPQRAPAQEVKPTTSVRGGPVGAEVTVTLSGLLAYQPVRMGFGSLSQYQPLERGEADVDGRFAAVYKVPPWAEVDRVHYFVVTVGPRRVPSDPFHVTDPNGVAHITGPISTEPTGCLVVEGRDKALYALAGETGVWETGRRVLVTGTVAEKSECGGKGLPIAVREIQPL